MHLAVAPDGSVLAAVEVGADFVAVGVDFAAVVAGADAGAAGRSGGGRRGGRRGRGRLLDTAMTAARALASGRGGRAVLASGWGTAGRRCRGGRCCRSRSPSRRRCGGLLDAAVSAAGTLAGSVGGRSVFTRGRSGRVGRVSRPGQHKRQQRRRHDAQKRCPFHGSSPQLNRSAPIVNRSPRSGLRDRAAGGQFVDRLR